MDRFKDHCVFVFKVVIKIACPLAFELQELRSTSYSPFPFDKS